MRADLHVMEQIDLYLQGKMSVTESSAFQAKMQAEPVLAQMVAEQQLFAQSVSRQAIIAEINLVAAGAGGAWYANPFVAAAGAVVVGGIVAAIVYYNSSSEAPEATPETQIARQVPANSPAPVEILPVVVEGDTIGYQEVVHPVDGNDNTQDPTADIAEDHHEYDAPLNDNGTPDRVEYDIEDQGTTGAAETDLNKGSRNASFPNGDLARKIYIEENVIYPGTAQKEKLQGTVKVEFNVDKEGQKSEIRATCIAMFDENEKRLNSTQMVLKQSIAKLFEDKAVSTVRTMPPWEPATDSQGNPVVSEVTIYFQFKLPGRINVYEIPENE
jgi:outer membrane biosynthesis protein TonB